LHCIFERVLVSLGAHCTKSSSGADLKHNPI
jgi:hypothetical protein